MRNIEKGRFNKEAVHNIFNEVANLINQETAQVFIDYKTFLRMCEN